jgi:hypothetical protein
MNLAGKALAAAMLTIISSAASAHQAMTGTVTAIDRSDGALTLQQTEGGTVGSSSGGIDQQFEAHPGQLDIIHVGDRISVFVSEIDRKKTISKIELQ